MLPFAETGDQPTQVKTRLWGLIIWLTLLFVLFISIGFLIATNVSQVAADTVDFVEEFRATGRYGFAANGVGTRGDPITSAWTGSGTFTLTIPSTANISLARLIWTGRSTDFDLNGVLLERDGVPVGGGLITSDYKYSQDPWCCSGAKQLHESQIITNLILPGTHTYTVSDHQHGTAPVGNNLNYGVGIWVVYQDNSEPEGEVVIYQGQDSFFRLWDPPRGPHTQVRCATFAADTQDRVADVIHLVSGVDTFDSNTGMTRMRSVAFWHETGSGAMPPADETPSLVSREPTLSTRPNAEGLISPGQFPLQSYANLEWDNFRLTGGIDIPAGNTWSCFQIESGDSTNLSGLVPNPATGPLQASGMWNLFAIRLRPATTTDVDLISFTGHDTPDQQVTLNWETAVEVNNYGFNLYRSDTDQFPGGSPIGFVSSDANGSSGATYQYEDTVPNYGEWYYWLEDIDTKEGATLHGPVKVLVSRFQNQYFPLISR